jgi:hypothetical protein
MNKALTLIIAIVCTITFISAASFATAAKSPRPSKKAAAAEPAPSEPVYEASAPSAYCLEHPSQCKQKNPRDRSAGSPYEHCVDVYGNGDGFVSEWEIGNFGARCR